MKETEQLLFSAGESIEFARQYMEQQGDLIRLEAAERISTTTSALVTVLVVAFMAVLTMLMLSLALGFWLGEQWGSNALAFLVIGGIYAVLGLMVFFFKRTLITNPVLNFTLDAFFSLDTDQPVHKND